MTDDVRAAAERLGLMLIGDGCQYDYANASDDCIADLMTVGRAWRAEHPADDAKPVTEAWAVGAGATVRFRTERGTVHLSTLTDETPEDVGWIEVVIRSDRTTVRVVAGGNADGAVTMKDPGRGQVKAACATFGIRLASPNDGQTEL